MNKDSQMSLYHTHGERLVGVANVSCCLAEKEIPIPVKQEPVESKEPILEADKTKSRYKKFIPPVFSSPVSINVSIFNV